MAGLQLRVLGDLEVVRDGRALTLPPSRKTRGLLAYLALNPRPMRREQLCELLWEIPDDPRGSLRWSLSKIRKLVDDEAHPRIIADRTTVAFDPSNVDIDLHALHRDADTVAQASVDELIAMAHRNQGVFLEGLDLPNFHDFHAWCVGERQRTVAAQAQVLAELGKRLAGQPEQALEYALSLVSLTPFDESPRAELIRLLIQLDRRAEAEHQFKVGTEKLAELGVAETGALSRAMNARAGAPAARAAVAPAHPVHVPSSEPPLVGRTDELASLQQRVDHLAAGAAAEVVLIRGEPGIGKSCLLQAVAAMARRAGAGLLKASGFESEMIRPFGVWNDALKRAMPDNPVSQLLASGEQVSREQVFELLAQLLQAETSVRPLVVLCDDVQWADESSVNAMHHVIRHHARQPMLVVATAREVELRDNLTVQQVLRELRAGNVLHEVQLPPLPDAQIAQLVRTRFPAADGALLAMESGGNPLLALELARAGQEGGSSLDELVEGRMGRFEPQIRELLQWAAVLTPRINPHCLERVSGASSEDVQLALEMAEEQGILHPGERGMRFAHDLVRASVYQSISRPRRRAMHRRVAELLAQDAAKDLDLAVDLAHHARRSEDPLLAARAMVSAGRLCLRFYANEDALALYREGLEFAGQLSEAQRVCLLLELGEIRMGAEQVADWQQLEDEFIRLAEQAMDHGAREHAQLGYQMASYLRWWHGELSEARRFSMQAERISRGATDEAQVLGLAEASKCLALLERDLSRAEAMAMEARAVAQRVGYDCPSLDLTFGILRYYQGMFDTSVEHLEDARTLAKAGGDRLNEYMANEYLTMVEMERRDCQTARRHTDALIDIGARIREGSERPFAEALRACCQYGLTDDDSGLAQALADLRVADAKQRLAFVLNRASIQYLEHGEPQRAARYAAEALELARIMERPSEALQALVNLERARRAGVECDEPSVSEQIARLLGHSVAGWARQRAHALASEEEVK